MASGSTAARSDVGAASGDADGGSAARATYTIEVREKKGFFRAAIPTPLPPAVAILCAVLNCLVPGFGTLLSSPFCFAVTTWSAGQKRKNFGVNILAGFMQLITAVVVVGWCWSVLWAIEYLEPIRNERRK